MNNSFTHQQSDLLNSILQYLYEYVIFIVEHIIEISRFVVRCCYSSNA